MLCTVEDKPASNLFWDGAVRRTLLILPYGKKSAKLKTQVWNLNVESNCGRAMVPQFNNMMWNHFANPKKSAYTVEM